MIRHLPRVGWQVLKGASEVSGLCDNMWRIERTLENLIHFELVEASCQWMIDSKDASTDDYRRFVRHIGTLLARPSWTDLLMLLSMT